MLQEHTLKSHDTGWSLDLPALPEQTELNYYRSNKFDCSWELVVKVTGVALP